MANAHTAYTYTLTQSHMYDFGDAFGGRGPRANLACKSASALFSNSSLYGYYVVASDHLSVITLHLHIALLFLKCNLIIIALYIFIYKHSTDQIFSKLISYTQFIFIPCYYGH